MAQNSSAPRNKQEAQLYTSFGDCDGVDIYQTRSVLKPIIDASQIPVYGPSITPTFTDQRNDNKRSKSCFPRIFSQNSNDVLGGALIEGFCPVPETAEWKGEETSHHIKHQRTATWQKSCSRLVPAGTIVIVEDVDSSSDEEDIAGYENGYNSKYLRLEDDKLAQDRGRPLPTRDSSGRGGERFRCINYEDSVSPFSLGSRASSASDASTGYLEDRADHDGREGQCRS